jgi:N-acetylmuramoyl-L-alanine amidase
LSPRQRRQVLKALVKDNVYIKHGKRPPFGQRRRWVRWLALGVAVPGVAAGALLFRPSTGAAPLPGRTRAAVSHPAPAPRLRAAAAPRAARPPAASGAAELTAEASLRLLGEPRTIDSAVFPVGVRRIVLDPGHGGKDRGSVTLDGHPEKDITLDIALRLRDLLREQQGVEVFLTRERDEEVLLRERARFANERKADLFVSIHLNWLVPATNRGVETFYLGPTEDPFLVQLTSRENRESGYSLADVRRLLDGIYLDLRQQESQRLASSVQKALYRSLKEETPALRDRGVKTAPFLVLVTTEMPAILAEVSCLSNKNEAALLATEEYRQGIAEALRAGIEAYTVGLTRAAATGSPT